MSFMIYRWGISFNIICKLHTDSLSIVSSLKNVHTPKCDYLDYNNDHDIIIMTIHLRILRLQSIT